MLKLETIELKPGIHDYTWPIITDEIIQRVIHHLTNDYLSEYTEETGPLKEFECAFAEYHKIDFSLLKSSGTMALYSAYHAIGIRPGDTVMVPAFTFVATAGPLLFLGAKIILIDCDEQGNIDPIDLEKKIEKFGTKAVVVTHNGGIPADMDQLLLLKKQHKFALIEDCARAPGSEYNGKKVGTFGDIACFSFQEKKAVFGGEGGMIITNNKLLYEKMILTGHYFRSKSTVHIQDDSLRLFSETGFGLNFSIHPLAVAIAHTSFLSLNNTVLSREESGNFFKDILVKNGVVGMVPMRIPEYSSKSGYYHYIFHYNPKTFPGINRETYVAGLRNLGVDIRISDNKPLHHFPIFQKKGIEYFGMPGAEVIAEGINKADLFFETMLTIPPITDKEILLKYVDIISNYEHSLNNFI